MVNLNDKTQMFQYFQKEIKELHDTNLKLKSKLKRIKEKNTSIESLQMSAKL